MPPLFRVINKKLYKATEVGSFVNMGFDELPIASFPTYDVRSDDLFIINK